MKQFRVTSEKGYYFICKVFDTKPEMYDYYLRYVKKRELARAKENHNPFNFDGFDKTLQFAAIVIPYELINIKEDGTEIRDKNIGQVLFYKDRLGGRITTHEILHCCLWHERLIEGNSNAEFGQEIGEVEERLCYTMTTLFGQFNDKCHKFGLYQ